MDRLIVIGGGLAGSEAAWQAAKRGLNVLLYEMRPGNSTGAHTTGLLGELVCSNSLKSRDPFTASGLLKRELDLADSLIMEAAKISAIPAGTALAADRNIFAEYITQRILDNPKIKVIRKEVKEIPEEVCILATGPLTSMELSESLKELIGKSHLYFYDAIAPILDADTLDYSKVFKASRYNKGGNDYINCPMTREEYEKFYHDLIEADTVMPRPFEDERVFEGCMPIEILAKRGKDTLRFGPMKPVGLVDPKNGLEPYAAVQLRPENRDATAYNMVGFQTRLKWPEQRKVFRLIPGLEHAEFLRYGNIHRNTFINSPLFLNPELSLKMKPNIYIAGQLTGVEGYTESTAMGLLAGINAARRLQGLPFVKPPRESAHGSLLSYITGSSPKFFQPSNINFALFPPIIPKVRERKIRREMIVERAIDAWLKYLKLIG